MEGERARAKEKPMEGERARAKEKPRIVERFLKGDK
jgi:hypothetical protein